MTNSVFAFAARRARLDRSVCDAAQAGFTLVEMLVVITIIGLIMALVGPRVLGYLGESKVKAAKIQIESFSAALDLFYLDNGRYPATNEGLAALVQRPGSATVWNGPYLRTGAVPLDPWGHPYLYKFPGDHSAYEIASRGPAGDAIGAGSTSMIKSAAQ
jgi:general secretion pathway protein G